MKLKFKDYLLHRTHDFHIADDAWVYNIYAYYDDGIWIIKPFIWRRDITGLRLSPIFLQKIIAFSDSDFLFKLFEQAIPMLKRYAK